MLQVVPDSCVCLKCGQPYLDRDARAHVKACWGYDIDPKMAWTFQDGFDLTSVVPFEPLDRDVRGFDSPSDRRNLEA